MKLKFWTMAIPAPVVVRQEQEGVDHFMLLEIIVLV
jgi:hypothetical protein